MIGKPMKKLIIVCDEKTESYANYLRQLISTNDDKDDEVVGVLDGTVDASVWLEKEYLANKAQISSSEHVLFIGDGKVSKSEASSMIIKFEKYGMKYGWLGKRAMLMVEDETLDEEEYESFVKFCLSYEPDFEKITMKKPKIMEMIEKYNSESARKDLEKKESVDERDNPSPEPLAVAGGVAGVVAGAAVGAAGMIATAGAIVPAVGLSAAFGLSKGINKIQANKKVKDQQYRALTLILYIDGLNEFLEG